VLSGRLTLRRLSVPVIRNDSITLFNTISGTDFAYFRDSRFANLGSDGEYHLGRSEAETPKGYEMADTEEPHASDCCGPDIFNVMLRVDVNVSTVLIAQEGRLVVVMVVLFPGFR
jgi:hypothetical protein